MELIENALMAEAQIREHVPARRGDVAALHVFIVVQGLPNGVQMTNASGVTSSGAPYLRVFLTDGVLLPGQSIVESLEFKRAPNAPPASYTLKFLSGQGNP